MKSAIVTGANGFLGSSLCRRLSEKGISVTAVVRGDHDDRIKDIKDISTIHDDGNLSFITESVNDRQIDCFFHFGWTGSAGTLRGDFAVQLKNIENTCKAVEICSRVGCRRFVNAASIMEYEIEKDMRSEENIGKNSIYSSAKNCADQMARILADNMGVDYIRGIISNIYGPGEISPRFVNTTIRKLLKKEHCSFSPGEQTYDFIYIDDAIEEFILIGEKGIRNRTYYIGSKKPAPLKEFIIVMGNVVDKDADLGIGEIPFNGDGTDYGQFDIHAVERDTGYKQKVSFKEGIRRTAEWIRKQEQA
ncbi:MAG: NAD(P)-dependent oxidoreductase [Lachnospiraceae bacterium]|nr:NAD(P)-dependent oxidoreductase [Lachnospiraceae bacterium]